MIGKFSKERQTLYYLAQNMDRVIPFEELERALSFRSRQYIYTTIANIRRVMPAIQIYNVSGVGYVYEREK